MVALLADPITAPIPADLLPWQARAIVRSGELAVMRGLRLIGRGACRVRGHEGAPVYAVSSATRPNLAHLVWIERGRIHCTCEARTLRHMLTCTHAQFVRLLMVAEHAATFAAPIEESAPESTAAEPAPIAPEPAPDHEPTPSGPRCPTCAGPVDPTELAELGECLNCLLMRADYERAEREAFHAAAAAEESIPCWACGATPANEERGGFYCEKCMRLPEKERKTRARLRQQEIARQLRAERAERTAKDRATEQASTARKVIARAKANAGIPSEASPRAARRSRQQSAQSATK